MSLDEFRVCVRPGDGLVARFPTSVLVVTATDWAGMPAVDGLLEECRRATAERPLPERLAELVDQAGPQAVPAFCALADDADGLALFVHGDSQVVITGAQPVMRLSGRGAGGWTSGIHDRVASLIIVPAHGSTEVAPTDDYVDLRDGIVPGSAIRLLPRQGPAQGPASSGATRVDRTDGGALPRPDRRRRAGSPAEADQPRALPAAHQP
ncbi:MAG: hypothetical protein M3083_19510, partial [Actinomycetota bacterium]|nr:hypothetical protein [Actinomycetota bacterium]